MNPNQCLFSPISNSLMKSSINNYGHSFLQFSPPFCWIIVKPYHKRWGWFTVKIVAIFVVCDGSHSCQPIAGITWPQAQIGRTKKSTTPLLATPCWWHRSIAALIKGIFSECLVESNLGLPHQKWVQRKKTWQGRRTDWRWRNRASGGALSEYRGWRWEASEETSQEQGFGSI